MLADALIQIIGGERRAGFVGGDPGTAGSGEVHAASAPAVAVPTPHVRRHPSVAHPAPTEQCDLRSGVVLWL